MNAYTLAGTSAVVLGLLSIAAETTPAQGTLAWESRLYHEVNLGPARSV